MTFMLVFILFCMILFFYLLFDRNILSPTVIGTSMFFVSSLFAFLYSEKWHTDISVNTLLIIITSIMAMGAGEFLIHIMCYKRTQFVTFNTKNDKPIFVKKSTVYFIVLIFSLLLLNYYKETVRIATEAGYKKGGDMLMLFYARIAVLNEKGLYSGRNRLASISFNLLRSLSYLFTYIFLYNKIILKQKKIIYQIFPVLLFIPYLILTTGRTEFIYMITIWIIIGSVFFMQTKSWNPRYTGKIVIIGIVGIGIFLLFFIIAGSFKSNKLTEHAFDSIAFYTGLSIPSLDSYFTKDYPDNSLFGEHTLYGIYYILRKFRFSIPKLYQPFEFATFHNVRGNVFTVIRRYHQDFGFFGLYFMMFFLGFFYSFLFLKFNKTRRNMGLLFYASILSPIVEMSIEERFFMFIVSVSTLYSFLYMYIFFRIFVNKPKHFYNVIFKPAFENTEVQKNEIS